MPKRSSTRTIKQPAKQSRIEAEDQPVTVVDQPVAAADQPVTVGMLKEFGRDLSSTILEQLREDNAAPLAGEDDCPPGLPSSAASSADRPPGLSEDTSLHAMLPSNATPRSLIAAPSCSITLDTLVDLKIQQKIIRGDYVDLNLLIAEQPEDFASIRQGDEGITLTIPKPKGKALSFTQWVRAFLSYASVYLRAHPGEACELFKYMDSVTVLMVNNGDWRAYDEHFRRRREKVICPWNQFCPELYVLNSVAKKAPSEQNTHDVRPSRRGICFPFQEGKKCRPGCNYDHACARCNSTSHGQKTCPSTPKPQTLLESGDRNNNPC